MTRRVFWARAAWLSGCAGGALLSGALTGDASAEQETVVQLERVTVTARNIEEPAWKLPFALTVADDETLRKQGLRDTQHLARQVPNFNHADSGLGFSNLVNMRGIGSSSALISPSVNYYIDGVPVPARVFDLPLPDVERVEVLRGPQGTHFGLNSQAGAVNFITGDPADQLAGSLGVLFGSHGRKEVDFSLEGPISNGVAGQFSGRLNDFDGDIANIIYSAPGVISSSETSIRSRIYGTLASKLVVEPDADNSFTLSGSWSRDKQRPTTGMWLDDPEFPRNAFNPLPEYEVEAWRLSGKYERDLGWANLTATTGFFHYATSLEADIVDGLLGAAQSGASGYMLQVPGLNVRRIDEKSAQLSQEVRLDGESAGGTRWVGGVAALWSDFDSTTDITSLALANGSYQGQIETTNLAVFGEVTVPLADRLDWMGGLRLTHEKKDFEGTFLGRNGALGYFSEAGTTDDTFLTGRTGLSYELGDGIAAYATIARGEKTGGYLFYNQFASLGLPLSPYDSSYSWSYEAGLKAADIGGWFDLGASIFFNDTTDEQLFTFNPVLGRFSVVNADTRSYGAELEAVFRPTNGFSLGANLALLNARISGGNLDGNEVPYAPSFSAALFAEYRHDVEIARWDGSAYLRAEYGHTGERMIDPANSRELPAYDLVNLRVGWQGERFELFGAIENLFDETYVTSAFQAGTNPAGEPVFAGVSGEGRSYLAGARIKF